MFNMDFVGMANTYDSRKVDRFEDGDLTISTAEVTDSDFPYETAVSHPSYNGGKWIIVEEYSFKQDAQKGHDKWVKKMTSKDLPKQLEDVSSAEVAKLAKGFGRKVSFEKE